MTTLFHELYGSYYRAVAAILTKTLQGPVTPSDMVVLCDRYAGGESALTIPAALRTGQWPLLHGDGTPLIHRPPTTPLTLLERRWLKAISLDPRVQLFDADFSFLGDVAPLFHPEDVLVFDRYLDGDDYADPMYIARFRLLLAAIREKQAIHLEYEGRKGNVLRRTTAPIRLEYSDKDDCFRLICQERRGLSTFRVSRIRYCRVVGERQFQRLSVPDTAKVVLHITDDRSGLERVSMHFAHLRKTVERVDDRTYRMTLWYDPTDEAEIVIRVLQFGALVRVMEPSAMVDLVRLRVKRQMELLASHGETGMPCP